MSVPEIESLLDSLTDDAIRDLLYEDIDNPEYLPAIAASFTKQWVVEEHLHRLHETLARFVTFSIDRIVAEVDRSQQLDSNVTITARDLIIEDLIARGWVIRSQPQAPEWPWPITDIRPSDGEADGLYFDNRVSGLRVCGYRVGKTHGMTQDERRRFLDYFLNSRLPGIVPELFGDDYGEPKSAKRLQKIANVIAANCRNFKRNNAKRYQVAIWHWEADLEFLRAKYYKNAGFCWPTTNP